MSDSLRPHGVQPTRLPCPWDSPGKSTGVGAIGCAGILSSARMSSSLMLWTGEARKVFCFFLSLVGIKLSVSYSAFSDAILAENLGQLFTVWQAPVFPNMVMFSWSGVVIVFFPARPLLLWSSGWRDSRPFLGLLFVLTCWNFQVADFFSNKYGIYELKENPGELTAVLPLGS